LLYSIINFFYFFQIKKIFLFSSLIFSFFNQNLWAGNEKEEQEKQQQRDTLLGTFTNFTNKEYTQFSQDLKKDKTAMINTRYGPRSRLVIRVNTDVCKLF